MLCFLSVCPSALSSAYVVRERWVVCYLYTYATLRVHRMGTTLMLASSEGHLECVKDLLDKGAKVNMLMKVSAVVVGPF